MKNKFYLKTIKALTVSFLMLFYASCTTEAIDNEVIDSASVGQAFTLQDFEDSFVKENLVVNWNDYALIGENTTVYEFDAYLNNKEASLDYALGYKIKHKVLATKDEQGSWAYQILKFNILKAEDFNNISITKLNNFTGTLYEYSLSGQTLGIKGIKEGVLMDQMALARKSNDLAVQSLFTPIVSYNLPPDWDCAGDFPPATCPNGGGEDGSLVRNTTETITDGFSQCLMI